MTRLKFGVLLGDVPGELSPADHLDGLLRQVEAAQRNGFSLLALGQHFLYGDVRWLQPIPTIARLAGEVDAHFRFATFVLVTPLYHPVPLAEDLASLDLVTGGRLVVGLGLGYRREEFRQLGIPFGERIGRFEEAVPLLRRLWTETEVTHEGRFWSLDAATPHIVPAQQPTPPIWIGANAEPGVRRSARFGDAWPIGPRMPLAEVADNLRVYDEVRRELGLPSRRHPIRREMVVGADRDAARARFQAMTASRFEAYAARERLSLPGSTAAGEEAETAILGDPEDVRAQLSDLAASLPIDTVIIRAQWPGMDADAVCSYLDELGRDVILPLTSASQNGEQAR